MGGKSEWFTVSDDCSIVGGVAVDVREHPMFDHEMNYDLDCEISIDSGDVTRVLGEQEPDEKKWTTKRKKPYNFVAGCWFGGSASFDVKVEDNEDEWVFKLRLREANFSIGDWSDILGRLMRRPKKSPCSETKTAFEAARQKACPQAPALRSPVVLPAPKSKILELQK